MRRLCFIIAILGDDPEDTLARAMVKWLLGQGVNVMTMSPAKGEGNLSYPLERVEKAIAWLQAHGTHFVFPEGMMKNYSFVFQNVYKQITPTQTKYRPLYPGDRYFYSALSLSSAVPRGR